VSVYGGAARKPEKHFDIELRRLVNNQRRLAKTRMKIDLAGQGVPADCPVGHGHHVEFRDRDLLQYARGNLRECRIHIAPVAETFLDPIPHGLKILTSGRHGICGQNGLRWIYDPG
jgi:hypothetical protein